MEVSCIIFALPARRVPRVCNEGCATRSRPIPAGHAESCRTDIQSTRGCPRYAPDSVLQCDCTAEWRQRERHSYGPDCSAQSLARRTRQRRARLQVGQELFSRQPWQPPSLLWHRADVGPLSVREWSPVTKDIFTRAQLI